MRRAIAWGALLSLPFWAQAEGSGILIDDFENGLKPDWEIKQFRAAAGYTVVEDGSSHRLRAVSRGTAPGLVYSVKLEPK